jgi:hypothetical protein
MHAEPSHWLHEISISKTVCHHFWPGLIPPLQTGGAYLLFSWVCLPSSVFLLLAHMLEKKTIETWEAPPKY